MQKIKTTSFPKPNLWVKTFAQKKLGKKKDWKKGFHHESNGAFHNQTKKAYSGGGHRAQACMEGQRTKKRGGS